MWKPAGLAVLMLAIAVPAFAIPLTAFPDCNDCAAAPYRDRLRGEAELLLGLPAIRLQVVEAVEEGPNPEDVSGVVAVRSLFGVRTGTFTTDGSSSDSTRSASKEALLWGGFLAVEVALGFIAARLWLRE